MITSMLCMITTLATPVNTQPIPEIDRVSGNSIVSKQSIVDTIHSKWFSQKTSTTTEQEPLDFSGTGRPGQQTAGESRGDCPNVDTPLTALLPLSHWGKTINERPTFWFYVPYSVKQIQEVEFVLQDEQRQDIYRSYLTLDKTPGYVNFSLPSTVSPLELSKWYVWYFKVYCSCQEFSAPLFVQGWVKRVPLNSVLNSELKQTSQRRDRVYARYQIWYDAVDRLARLHLVNPVNPTLRKDWHKLLSTKGVRLEELNSIVK